MSSAAALTPIRFSCTTSHRQALAGRVRYRRGVSDNRHYQDEGRTAAQLAHIHAAERTHNHHGLLGDVGPGARALHAVAIAHLHRKGVQPIDEHEFMNIARGLSSRPMRLVNQLLAVGLCHRVAGGAFMLSDADLYDLPSVAEVQARREAWRAARAQLRAAAADTVPIIADDCVIKSRDSANVREAQGAAAGDTAHAQPARALRPPQRVQLTPDQEDIVKIAARYCGREAVLAEWDSQRAKNLQDAEDLRAEKNAKRQQIQALYGGQCVAGGVLPVDAMAYADSRAAGLRRMPVTTERQWQRLAPTRKELQDALAKNPRNWGQVLAWVQASRGSADLHGAQDGGRAGGNRKRTPGATGPGRVVG